jgi:hypothetical protein
MVGRLLLILGLVAGCAAPGTLVTETGHHRWTARDRQTGVTVVLTTGVWQGQPPGLEQDLTVMHVLVANMGKSPVLLAPGDLELRDRRGFRYALLDPGATFYRVDETQREGDAYGRTYQASYDPGRSTKFEEIFATGDMARDALPWGVLAPGTQMRGYLYFESMTHAASGGQLVWHLATPERQPLVDMAFDFAVAR